MKRTGWLGGDRAFRTAFAAVAATGGLLTTGDALLRGGQAALSVGVGCLIALGNLYVLRRILDAVLVPHVDAKSHGKLAWTIVSLGKLMTLCFGMWLLMTRGGIAPIELFVGYGALPIGIAFYGIVSDKTDPETPSAPPST